MMGAGGRKVAGFFIDAAEKGVNRISKRAATGKTRASVLAYLGQRVVRA